MKKVCIYCPTVMEDGPSFPVSHGMCPPCTRRVHQEIDRWEQERATRDRPMGPWDRNTVNEEWKGH